jgi:hypothetical protein
MHKRIWLGVFVAALAVAPVSGCRSQGKGTTVDTTKDIYRDDEVPAFQIEVVNGVEERIPWERVHESQRWLTLYEPKGDHRLKHHVPIVRVEYSSLDKEGRRVPLEQGYEVNRIMYGLNPKYFLHTYFGKAH